MKFKKLSHEEFMEKLLNSNEHFANGEIEVLGEYMGSNVSIQCKCLKCGHIFERIPSNLYKNTGCPECLRLSKFISNEEFIFRLSGIGSGVIALDEYQGVNTPIRFQCSKGHIWSAKPASILNGTGCPYCAGKKVLVGYNDMWTTRPDIAELLNNPDDGYKYTCSSGIELEFKCPDCGSIVKRKPCIVSYYGTSCHICSDSISYPNKFGRAFLKQLPIENYKYEYQPNWAKPYFYDNYFEYDNSKYIIEMDGGLHYREGEIFHKPLEERKRIDNLKTELAIQNGINIIRIECLESNCDYIKKNILTSELNAVFDLSNIDWKLCDESAQKRFVKEACNLYMSGITTKEIALQLCVSTGTVYKYIKTGRKLGWCDSRQNAPKSIAINLVDNDENVIHSFCSMRNSVEQIKEIYGININKEGIRNSCQTHKPYKGFNFRYANETTQN